MPALAFKYEAVALETRPGAGLRHTRSSPSSAFSTYTLLSHAALQNGRRAMLLLSPLCGELPRLRLRLPISECPGSEASIGTAGCH